VDSKVAELLTDVHLVRRFCKNRDVVLQAEGGALTVNSLLFVHTLPLMANWQLFPS
jgi:hypothetical protein